MKIDSFNENAIKVEIYEEVQSNSKKQKNKKQQQKKTHESND